MPRLSRFLNKVWGEESPSLMDSTLASFMSVAKGMQGHLGSSTTLPMTWHLPERTILAYSWTADFVICLGSLTYTCWKAIVRTDFFSTKSMPKT